MNDFKNAFDLLNDASLTESNNYGWKKCVRKQLHRILMYYPRIDLEKFNP
jgi:hypothetical protein